MSEQDKTQASLKRSRSLRASKQNDAPTTTPQCPNDDDKAAWKAYWREQGQYWRTEPEIGGERQKYLKERGNIKPDIENGIYPFKDVKLSRADIEWLLASHENGRGPVDWSDESQWGREGLDLRGADLSQEDFTYLPLTRILGGLRGDEWPSATKKQCDMAAVHMQGAKFIGTHLEGAHLRFAHLENAYFLFTRFDRSHLRGAYLVGADLREANLLRVRLEGTVLCDEKHIGPRLADAHIETNLAVVNWAQIKMLGDEFEAHQKKRDGKVKDSDARLNDYQLAVRANRQLAVALQDQGLNEVAARFAYRAQKLQRTVFRLQGGVGSWGQYFFSLFLDILAGYGYKPWRSFLAYLLVIIGFAITYHQLDMHKAWNEAIVISMTAFHGRGFFPDQFHPGDPQAFVAAIEAFVGLLIEVTLIATLTQRLFGK